MRLDVFAYDLAGLRPYQKAGFKEVGRRREAHCMGGRRWGVVLMDCLATEFESPVLGRILVPDAPRPETTPTGRRQVARRWALGPRTL